MKTRVSFKYYLSCCLWGFFFDSNAFQIRSHLSSLTFLVTLRLFTLFSYKFRAIKLQKFLKLALLRNRFLDLFTEVELFLGRFLERYRQFMLKY